MEEKTLLAFAKWLQSKDQQFANVPAEQLAAQVAQALQTPEGQKQLAPLFQQFQAEVGQVMRNGGKMNYAISRLQPGGTTPVKGNVPRYNYDEVWYNGHMYRKRDGVWESTPDPDRYGHKELWREVPDQEYYGPILEEHVVAYSPSTKELDEIRNGMAVHHPAKTVDGGTGVLVTRPVKITSGEAQDKVYSGKNFSNRDTWYENGVDSTMVVIKNPDKPEVHSNQDWQVQWYRKYPLFRAISDAVGYKPSYIRYSEEYNKK